MVVDMFVRVLEVCEGLLWRLSGCFESDSGLLCSVVDRERGKEERGGGVNAV
jgi:hypothetical protein